MGLREVKKARTRQALAATAMRLFTDRGYEGTTVEDVAAAAEVSQRTFFRYFPTKEDVLAEIFRSGGFDTFTGALDARPAAEPLAVALRAAAVVLLESAASDPPAALAVLRMVAARPELRARFSESVSQQLDALTGRVARRLPGADPLTARLVAGWTLSTMTTVMTTWEAADGHPDLLVLCAQAFDRLGPALAAVAPAAQG